MPHPSPFAPPPPARPLLVLLRSLIAWLGSDQPAPPPPAPPSDSADETGFSDQDSASSVPNNGKTAPDSQQPRRAIGPRGVQLIKLFEGCAKRRADGRIEAYPDPGTGAEPWTIGWGATGRDHVNGGRIGPGTIWSQAQCDARLARDLVRYANDVARALGTAPTTQGQFDAMVSFHYNTGAIARATLTRKHIAGDFTGAAAEFARWNRAGGRVLRGLTRRREAEAELYRS
jgi:lysozyme